MVYDLLVVGSGGHALNHWRSQLNVHGEFKPSGVVDTNPEVLEHARVLWGVDDDAVGTTIDEVLEAGVHADVALICTPIESHHALAIEAMRNGMHVICEKNMAHSMQAAVEMAKCALEHPRLATVVGHQYPYWRRSNWAMRKAIGTGVLGRLDSIQCSFNGSGYWNPAVPTRSGWRRFLDHDYLEDWAVHTLDLFRYFTAMDAIVVSADLWRPGWSRRYGTTSINIRMLLADPSEYDGAEPLRGGPGTEEARRAWQNGKVPSTWVRGQYTGHAETMGMVEHGEHWMIQGHRGSMEYMEGGYRKNEQPVLRVITHDMPVEEGKLRPATGHVPSWSESSLQPYPCDLECGPAAQWHGDNTVEEWDNNCFILEQLKQCIESDGRIKPLRCFENCIKTLAIVTGAIESSARGGQPVFLPDRWEVPR